jgi:hypothetical protein
VRSALINIWVQVYDQKNMWHTPMHAGMGKALCWLGVLLRLCTFVSRLQGLYNVLIFDERRKFSEQ